MNYLQTIFTSYYKDPICLTDLLIQAKRDNNILDTVFYSECTSIVTYLKKAFNSKLGLDQERINRGFLNPNLTPAQEANFDEQLKNCTLENITIQLLTVTNGLFSGKLNYSEVEFIENAINKLQAPSKQKDTKFVLTVFENADVQQTSTYKSLSSQIDNNGFILYDDVKIYTPELSYFFYEKSLPAYDCDKKENVSINGINYLDTYVKAFKEGEQFFQSEFASTTNILYGDNADTYIQNIFDNYFSIAHEAGVIGWNFVKKHYPAIIKHDEIKKFGYYAGIVSKADELIKRHQKIFEKFDVVAIEYKNTLKEYQIEEFKTSFNAGLFNEILSFQKQNRKTDYITEWYKKTDNEFNENSIFGAHKELIILYNKNLFIFSLNVLELYKSINSFLGTNDNGFLTKMILKREKIARNLKTIKSYAIKIKKQSLKSTDTELIKTREYTITQLNEIIHELQNNYAIDLLKSPFKDEIEQIQNELHNSISTDLIPKINTHERGKKGKKIKTINDFIFNVDNKEGFIKDLQKTFNTEKGIHFKILIELLKDEKIFMFSNFSEFFRSISPIFRDEIGSQTGLNDLYKHSDSDKILHKAKIDLIN